MSAGAVVNIVGFGIACAMMGACSVLVMWNRSLTPLLPSRGRVAVICGLMALAGMLLATMQGMILAWRLAHGIS